MMTAVQIIQTICPKLADSPSLSQFVQIAQESLDGRFFGKMYQQAIAYKACHLFELTANTANIQSQLGSSGAITSYKEGGIDISFAASSNDNELNSTKYGKMLLALIKAMPRMNVNRNCMPVFPIMF